MTTVILPIAHNRGYAADQIQTRVTLADLAVAIEDAIARYGEDATVVLHDGGSRYGANFGEIVANYGCDVELLSVDEYNEAA